MRGGGCHGAGGAGKCRTVGGERLASNQRLRGRDGSAVRRPAGAGRRDGHSAPRSCTGARMDSPREERRRCPAGDSRGLGDRDAGHREAGRGAPGRAPGVFSALPRTRVTPAGVRAAPAADRRPPWAPSHTRLAGRQQLSGSQRERGPAGRGLPPEGPTRVSPLLGPTSPVRGKGWAADARRPRWGKCLRASQSLKQTATARRFRLAATPWAVGGARTRERQPRPRHRGKGQGRGAARPGAGWRRTAARASAGRTACPRPPATGPRARGAEPATGDA